MIHATTALALAKLAADYRRCYFAVDVQWYRIKRGEIIKNFAEVMADENTETSTA